MKKNVMLKIASVLMVAVLLTTCAISSTFAKYVTTGGDSVTAQVAKWGVTADMTLDGLFSHTYTSADGKVLASAGQGTNVIAPGTYDELTLSTQISGTPEVSLTVDYTAEVTLTGFSDYCPLVFYVNDTKIEATGASDLVDKLEDAINDLDVEDIEPNVPLNTIADIKIEWEWLYEANDAQDTILGNAAAGSGVAGEEGYVAPAPATVTIQIDVNIYQTGAAAVKPAAQQQG